MLKFFERFGRDDAGVTAMEYGMIAALIAVVIIGVLGELGGELKDSFTKVKDGIAAANDK